MAEGGPVWGGTITGASLLFVRLHARYLEPGFFAVCERNLAATR
jgi:hypothetical protein